ncbi:lipoprotein N-acyltransferase Lnb domain-containing protein [Penaeicola halotolerans]|uniref:lipoprotein N-acyltransferase Lnb domain-containing protein n=1 Tax=Penaeicola halotolerans TaxID=2793196 RepID=UPI001CF86E1E|nr:DUF4105 domain-containing protein [Penaeicola halotolerans]
MRSLILSILILVFCQQVQAQQLSDQAKVSLLTCDPGSALYSAFGHSALRVHDPVMGLDLVFNYGTFDFNAPGFYVNFVRGKLNYFLAVNNYENFYRAYYREQRSMREQVLNLSEDQKQEVFDFLMINAQEENRYYQYDFFFDNCATRIRDVLQTVLGDRLKIPVQESDKTFRNLIDEYLGNMPWADFGIDLALGSVIDEVATSEEAMFLPDYMESGFAEASIVGDGPTRPLVASQEVIFDFEPVNESSLLVSPRIFWILLLIGVVLSYVSFKRNRIFRGFDIAWTLAYGLLGLLVAFLWFGTDHQATAGNWNILWAMPTHLLLAVALIRNKPLAWLSKYLLGAIIIVDAALLVWVFGVQSYHAVALPLIVLALLRLYVLYSRWLPRLK